MNIHTANGRVNADAHDRVHVTLRNPSPNLAFQVHVGIRRAGDEEELVPVLWEDNYLALMPGESRALTARYLKKGVLGDRATLVVDGWNVDPQEAAIPIAQKRRIDRCPS